MKSKARVMTICDNVVLAESLKLKIEVAGFEAVATRSSNAVQSVFDEVPHLLLIDEDFDNGRGRLIASLIKEDLILKYIPIVLMISEKMLFYRKKDIVADVYFEKDNGEDLGELMQKVLRESQNELDVNPLTHLPGIRSSVLAIEKRVESKESFAVCYVDLSDMAAFNSAYGDARGDDAIIKVASIIKDSVRQITSADAFVGHLGGDDLIFVTTVSDATKVSEAITRRFDEISATLYDAKDRDRGYIIQRNHEGMLTQYPIMSVLISIIYCEAISASRIFGLGRVASDLKQYMKLQAASCYIEYHYGDGKKAVNVSEDEKLDVHFPGKVAPITISKQETAVSQAKYEEFFDKILDKKLIYSVYQPIVDFRTKKIIGYEALTRSHEEKFKNPEHLFNLARESGKIKELDKICVDFALKSAQSIDPEKKLFLNINHETLMDARFMRHFFDEKGCIGFKNIVIEVTEQSLLRSFEKIKKALLELKEQGVFVAIDDVGGGAVSLRDVAVLKPEYIKFDRSLIRQIDSNVTKQQIVISMLLFSSGIQAIVMAEGIETPKELETLLACGVYLGQGYLFVRPGLPFPKVDNI